MLAFAQNSSFLIEYENKLKLKQFFFFKKKILVSIQNPLLYN